MNYLGHACFSYQDPNVLVGNMVSDFVKGKRQHDFPPMIQAGIRLHRRIDQFTDEHPAVARAKTVFRPAYRLYAGAFVDVAFDFFIANDPRLFPTEIQLADFSQWVYANLQAQQQLLPEGFARMLPYMTMQNWLLHYRTREGIGKSFGGLVRRAAHLTDPAPAIAAFDTGHDLIEEAYGQFMTDFLPWHEQQKAEVLAARA